MLDIFGAEADLSSIITLEYLGTFHAELTNAESLQKSKEVSYSINDIRCGYKSTIKIET